MRKIILIIASLILATPFAASAEIVRLTYTGTVDYLLGDGFGYSNFDEITGWFEYDVDEYIALCPPGSGFCQIPVESSTGDGGFAWSLGFVLDERNTTTGRFFIEDGSGENNRSPIFDTQGLEIGYVLTFGEFYHDFFIDYLMSPRGGLTIYSGTETCFYADNSCIFDVAENIVGFTQVPETALPTRLI
jgi:hypothetical protein